MSVSEIEAAISELSNKDLADKNFKLLKTDPYHPSLHFKKVGRKNCSLMISAGK